MTTSAAAAAIRKEVDDQIAVLVPEIQGLDALDNTAMSAETVALDTQNLENHERRNDLCKNLIKALDDLEADGYPDLPTFDVPKTNYDELIKMRDAIDAALTTFTPAVASKAVIDLGAAIDKP